MTTESGARIVSVDGALTTRFGVLAPDATAVWLCVFDDHDVEKRYEMKSAAEIKGGWTVDIDRDLTGYRYGFRADGPFRPTDGLWFNPAKFLLDPYARAIEGTVNWHPALLEPHAGARRPRPLAIDSAPHMPRSIVTERSFDWQGDTQLNIPWNDTVIYELHVKGYTKLHPHVRPELRGTYLGLCEPAVISYLQDLGVTSLQLLPCAAYASEQHLTERGLTNYWGYNPISMFAPHPGYAISDAQREFKTMTRTLHAAGFEVILDVVFNHSAEGDHRGATLSFRGLDNRAWYRLNREHPLYYENHSGCGNALNTAHPATLAFTLDCLRYWAAEMHVDGFRFDLAASLGRNGDGNFDPDAAFFKSLAADPLLSRLKLIAEPWDVGQHGYQLGQFPDPWREFNGEYRDAVRAFWNHRGVTTGAFAERIAGSSDLYRHNERSPTSSVNAVTCHDGFTLHDLVSYAHKHNESNGESNRDGSNHNSSKNYGVEGPSDDPAILNVRGRQVKNMLATVVLSQGVPHLLAGDETGNTQSGNNNAYCQDNDTSWLSWKFEPDQVALLEFVKRLLTFRRTHPGFRRHDFLHGQELPGQAHISAIKDVSWIHPTGREMHDDDWHNPHLHAFAMLLAGHDGVGKPGAGGALPSRAHLLLFNAIQEPVEFFLPECPGQSAWTRIFDTSTERPALPFTSQTYRLDGQSCAAFTEQFATMRR